MTEIYIGSGVYLREGPETELVNEKFAVSLSYKESKLFKIFLEYMDRPLSHEFLVKRYSENKEIEITSIPPAIRRLRVKLGEIDSEHDLKAEILR